MIRLIALAVVPALVASPALAAADPHAGHTMPAAAADPHAGHGTPAPAAADPHAGHVMPAPASADPPAGPALPDPHAGHVMSPSDPPGNRPLPPARDPADPHAGHVSPREGAQAPGAALTGADLPVGEAAAPPPPNAPLADAVFGAPAMARARDVLRAEHGGMAWSKVMVDQLELRPASGRGAYAWQGRFTHGGDLHRFVAKTEGEGEFAGAFHGAEAQALYSRAIGPYFDLQAGVRHDFRRGPDRTYATVGVEGLAPYWFDVEAALFVSDKGHVSARLEGSYDLRFTQRLILQPSAELELAASKAPNVGVGSGLSSAEVGLRLRYELRRELAPYIGVHHERKLGATAAYARAAGEGAAETRLVIGVRAWF